MKMDHRRVWAVVISTVLLVTVVRAEETAVVKKDHVNVRGQATLKSEVITQLKKDENVVVLEEITPKKHKRGEPDKWAKIQLPSNTPVWVYAPYIDTGHTVNINRLNLRAGPGENFSMIGRIERGAGVKEIRTDGTWMEIEAPTNAFAFVAADMLDISAAPVPGPTEIATNTNAVPVLPPPTVENVQPEPAPVQPVETAPTTPQPTTTEPATQPVAPAPVVEDTTSARRIVSREGTVVYSRSIQAPSTFALESPESRLMINFLHSESEDIVLKKFAGKKVIVTGEELIDKRWANTPILEVDSVRLVP